MQSPGRGQGRKGRKQGHGLPLDRKGRQPVGHDQGEVHGRQIRAAQGRHAGLGQASSQVRAGQIFPPVPNAAGQGQGRQAFSRQVVEKSGHIQGMVHRVPGLGM